jgi:hypothetical protein
VLVGSDCYFLVGVSSAYFAEHCSAIAVAAPGNKNPPIRQPINAHAAANAMRLAISSVLVAKFISNVSLSFIAQFANGVILEDWRAGLPDRPSLCTVPA